MNAASRALVVVAFGSVAISAWFGTGCYEVGRGARRASARGAAQVPTPSGPRVVTRNVEASDYAGTAACSACHADVVNSFEASPMHRMTRLVTKTDVEAPFRGETLFLGEDRAVLETHAGARFVRIEGNVDGKKTPPLFYRVTRVLGGRHREDFVGIEVSGYDDVRTPGGSDEVVLPVSYLLERKRLRYKGYSVMIPERDHLRAGPVWDRTCPFCHNTVPLLSTLLGALAGPHPPHYQGEVVDALLPDSRAFDVRVRDEAGLDAALSREMLRLGAGRLDPSTPSKNVRTAIDVTRARFTGSKLLEVGIGCESCHGGCREHALDPRVHPSFIPRAPYLEVGHRAEATLSPRSNGADVVTPAEAETHACARCHQVLFSKYPWTWEGGRRDAAPGGSHINSGEGRDLLLGGCQGALTCTACHDPHAPDDPVRLASLESPRGNDVCLACHAALRGREAVRDHTHHDPDGAGSACLACHLPKKNLSLDGRLTRYHRIGSPTDAARVLDDRPLECALCHPGKSVASLVSTMETWWNKAYSRDALQSLYGDLDANVLRATLRRGKPHEKAVALSRLGAVGDRESAPLFAAELANEYPLVREYAAEALRATYGAACDIRAGEGRARLDEALSRCSAAAGFAVGVTPATPVPAPLRSRATLTLDTSDAGD